MSFPPLPAAAVKKTEYIKKDEKDEKDEKGETETAATAPATEKKKRQFRAKLIIPSKTKPLTQDELEPSIWDAADGQTVFTGPVKFANILSLMKWTRCCGVPIKSIPLLSSLVSRLDYVYGKTFWHRIWICQIKIEQIKGDGCILFPDETKEEAPVATHALVVRVLIQKILAMKDTVEAGQLIGNDDGVFLHEFEDTIKPILKDISKTIKRTIPDREFPEDESKATVKSDNVVADEMFWAHKKIVDEERAATAAKKARTPCKHGEACLRKDDAEKPCAFSHKNIPICTHFLQGKCKYGAKCVKKHPEGKGKGQ